MDPFREEEARRHPLGSAMTKATTAPGGRNKHPPASNTNPPPATSRAPPPSPGRSVPSSSRTTLPTSSPSSSSSRLSPHTHRLLRLLLDGGGTVRGADLASATAAAAAASSRLISLLQGSAFDEEQRWELAGRVQSVLKSRRWRSRTQAAAVLRAVASQLPLRSAAAWSEEEDGGGDSSTPHPPTKGPFIDNREKPPEESNETAKASAPSSLTPPTNDRPPWTVLTLDLLDDWKRQSREESCNLLLARSLRSFAEDDDRDGVGPDNDHLPLEASARWEQQTRILRRRLGLLSGFSEPDDTALTLTAAELMDDDSYPQSQVAASTCAPTKNRRRSQPSDRKSVRSNLPQGSRKRRRRRQRRERWEDDGEYFDDDSGALASSSNLNGEVGSDDSTLHALLRSYSSSAAANFGSSNHQHPHTILAMDLLCRMVDPAWHVRHGAFLGTLALLQSDWARAAATAVLPSSSALPEAVYNRWLHSVLVASLYVLVMDRFGDFSGAVFRESSFLGASGPALDLQDDGGTAAAVLASTVVAPVREMAGQVAATVWCKAPSKIRARVTGLLLEMSKDPEVWEVRHGALTALKYMMALAVPNRPGTTAALALSASDGPFLRRMVESAAEALLDESDDVQGAAAELLHRYFGIPPGDGGLLMPQVPSPSVVPNLWTALARARSHSSCLVDLIRLLHLFVQRDCRGFLHQIGAETKREPAASAADGVANVLVELLDCDFASVRMAALQCAGRLALPLAEQCEPTGDSAPYRLLMARIFDTFLRFPCVPVENRASEKNNEDFLHHTDSFMTHAARSQAWADLSANATALFHRDETLRIAFVDSLLRRYFSTVNVDAFQAWKDAADALSTFILATKTRRVGLAVPILEFYLLSFVRSPFSALCEAACLLVSSLLRSWKLRSASPCGQEQVFSTSFIKRLENLLWSMTSGMVQPPCLYLGTEKPSTCSLSTDPAIIRLCDDAFVSTIKELSDSENHKNCLELSDTLVELWSRIIEARAGSTSFPMQVETSVNAIRVHSSLAGATLALTIPSKITPIVRALMTSFKNETSPSRLEWTSTNVSSLLLAIEDQSQFATAREKVLDSLCAMVESEDTSEMRGMSPVSQALTRYISVVASSKPLKCIDPVWDRLTKILEYSGSVDEESVVSSVSLLEGISKGLRCCCEASFQDMGAIIERLTCLALETQHDELRARTEHALQVLCSSDPARILLVVLRTLHPYLKESKLARFRSKASSLLETIVSVSGESLCPFVKALLPIVMLLMTDPCQECSRCANRTFSSLVRLAPLVQEGHSVNITNDDLSGCESVIDHLIMGKPLPPITLPDEIQSLLCQAGVSLRPYQLEGVAWLRFLQTMQLNGALCDSMGLGKTLQALIAIALSHSDAPYDDSPTVSLIVCPSTVVGHWMAEIAKFFPDSNILRPVCYVGSKAQRVSLWKLMGSSANVVITSYAMLRTDADILTKPIYRSCTLDEGHLLKNPKTATARAARQIIAKHRVILTGTPVQNRVHELWAAFDFLMPNFLGSASAFSKEFALPITRGQSDGANASSVIESLERLTRLHQQVLPFILRREKDEVLKDLPPKVVSYVKVTMTNAQDRLYRRLCSHSTVLTSLNKLEDILKPTKDSGTASTVDKEVLKSLVLLRLLCTHPRLITVGKRHSDDDCGLSMSGKLLALADLMRNAGLDEGCITAADNDISLLYCDDPKEDAADDYCKLIETTQDVGLGHRELKVASGGTGKCIVFAQFTKSLDLVEDLILRPLMPRVRYLRLDGHVPSETRAELARRFNSDPSIRLFLSTTRVGGLGLNLTGADTVFFLENDYNPFVDLQAQDRAHRIGQLKCVNVYNFVTNNSIEERIVDLQQKKIAISGAIVNTENSSMFSMGTDRILDIFESRSYPSDESAEGETLDIDALIEQHSNDYASLSVDEFLKGLEND